MIAMEKIYSLEFEARPNEKSNLQKTNLLGYYSSFSMAEEAACVLMQEGLVSIRTDFTSFGNTQDSDLSKSIEQLLAFIKNNIQNLTSLDKCNQIIQSFTSSSHHKDYLEVCRKRNISEESQRFITLLFSNFYSFEWVASNRQTQKFIVREHAVDERVVTK